MEVILGLGSNRTYKGMSPVELLAFAVRSLSRFVSDIKVSSVYETRPMYVCDQENFFNIALKGSVPESMSPEALLEAIHEIEAEGGRDRSKEVRFGPRSLDIDIEEFSDVVMNTEDLILPHPRIKERAFVLIPLLEIFSESADVEKRERYASWLNALPNQGNDEGVVKSPQKVQETFVSSLN